jgi:two-component system KDP operon response regulator KdpE
MCSPDEGPLAKPIKSNDDRHAASARAKLLLIERDPQVQSFLAFVLKGQGHALATANSGMEGLRLAALGKPDIVLIDLELPDIGGIEVIRLLREWYVRPIVVLSARSQEVEKIAALDVGADDYITKPFSVGELLARLRVAERHIAGRGSIEDVRSRIEIGALSINLATRRLCRDGTDLHLTRIEYRLLSMLMLHRGKVLTHRQLLREIWGPDRVESPQYLRMHVRALRQKIEPDPRRPVYLLTSTGVGYRFVDAVPACNLHRSIDIESTLEPGPVSTFAQM